MYLLYLDDSGSPQNVNENHFILGGFIIPETSLYWVNKNLDNLAEELPTNSADIVEFHASEIAGGRKSPWEQFKNKQERLDILKKVLQVATDSRNGIKILACAVEKINFLAQIQLSLRLKIYVADFINSCKENMSLIMKKPMD